MYDYVVADQSFVFDTLADPATHNGKAVERIDTPTSVVFLAGDVAYKLCRAVAYPELDQSSLSQRLMALEGERSRGCGFAAWLYQDIVPLTRDPHGSLAIGGGGETVEWALRMTRYDPACGLDSIASTSRIDSAMLVELGAMLAESHAGAPIIDGRRFLSFIDDALRRIGDPADCAEAFITSRERSNLRQTIEARLRDQRSLLIARGSAGLVRQCHGRAYLNHIVLHEGRPWLYAPAARFTGGQGIDVLYDLAASLVDLLLLGPAGSANTLLNTYLWRTRRDADLTGLALLPVFMAMRAIEAADYAAVRAPLTEGGERETAGLLAARYADLARRLLTKSDPSLVVIGGFSGTGKSTLAHKLAPGLGAAPGAVVLRSDVERKLLFGVAPFERLDEDAYRPEITGAVYRILCEKAEALLCAGHSVVIDAVAALPEERLAFSDVALRSGAHMTGIWLDAREETRLARVSERHHDDSDADAGVVRQQSGFDPGAIDWQRIDAEDAPSKVLDSARRASERLH
ncbi:MAG: AAA family ATPase [Hyphomicrobiaceae bacterium]|nr:AAA family ATPase [Hyphomicrobiaceae bacterium]